MPSPARGRTETSQSEPDRAASRERNAAEAAGPLDAWLDRALEQTFPASDPISSPPQTIAAVDPDPDF